MEQRDVFYDSAEYIETVRLLMTVVAPYSVLYALLNRYACRPLETKSAERVYYVAART